MTRPFRPSNGTQGDSFMSDFCHRCWRMAEDGRKPCEILGRILFSQDYVPEWVQDDDGSNPRCTAFEDIAQPEKPQRCDKTEDLFDQQFAGAVIKNISKSFNVSEEFLIDLWKDKRR